MNEEENNTVELWVARERAKTVAFIRETRAWAVKIGKGMKMPNSENHPRGHTPEKAEKILREIEFTDHNIGVHTHGNLVDVDVDVKDPDVLQYMLPALDKYLPPSNHVWGTEKRERTHRIYQIKGMEEYDPRNYPVLKRLQKIEQANVELRGGNPATGLFSLLPPSVHPKDGFYRWAGDCDPTVSPAITTPEDLIRGIRLAGGIALLAPHMIEGQRQHMCTGIAGFLHRVITQSETMGSMDDGVFSIDYDDALNFFMDLLDISGDDPKDAHMRKKGFEATWKKANAGGQVTGATSLVELTGDPQIVKKLYTLFTDNPELEKYQAFEEQFAIWTGKGTIIDMRQVDRGNTDSCLMTKEQFINSHMHMKCLIGDKRASMTAMLYQSPSVLRLDGFTFDPAHDERVVREGERQFVNYWSGFHIKPADDVTNDEVAPFRDYMWRIVCRQDKERYEWVMAWLADIVQQPADKPGTVLVLVGPQGAGKSFIGERVLGPIIGKNHYVSPTMIKRIGSQFNTMFSHKILIQLDEAMNSNQRQMADFMKGLITGDTYEVERKNHDVQVLPAHHRLLMTSNHLRNSTPVEGGKTDRRHTILEVSHERVGDTDYWAQMHEWMEDEVNLAKVHRYLLNVKYDKKLIRWALSTIEKSETATNSMEAFDRWLVEMLERGHPLHERTHNRWYQAPVGDKSERDEGAIIRDQWPTQISIAALVDDLHFTQRSYPNNIRETWNDSIMVKRLAEEKILVNNHTVRGKVRDTDDRTGQTIHKRIVWRQAPDVEAIKKYLVDKHGPEVLGGVVEDAIDEEDYAPEEPTEF